MSTPQPDTANARQVYLQRIYLKDSSLELPNAPAIFLKETPPQVDVQVGTAVDALNNNQYNVTLQVTVTARIGEETAFLVEVHQSGIFHLAGFSQEIEVQAILAAYCPNVLLPFAREAVASLVARTGYPPVLLQPINFDALYAQHLARLQAEQAQAGGQTPGGIIIQ